MGEGGERGQESEKKEEGFHASSRRWKRRKLHCGPPSTSTCISTPPKRPEIKVSSLSHQFFSLHDLAQDVQTGSSPPPPDIHASTESAFFSTHPCIAASQAPASLHSATSPLFTHIRGPHREGSAVTQRQTENLQGASRSLSTYSEIKSPLYEEDLSLKPPHIKHLSCSQGTLPPRKSFLFHAHYLPHDLVISSIVASRLPLINLIRSRTVCRAWRDSIFSPVIAKCFKANTDCQRPRLVVEHSSPLGPCLAVFDPCMCGWSVIPAPSLGRLVAASGGLFCYAREAGHPPSLVVGNPLTNRWKHLPMIPLCVPAHGPQIVGMVANNYAGSYKVIVLLGMWDDDASDAYLPFVYDSMSERWMRKSTVSARLAFATSRSVMKAPDTLLSVDKSAGHLLSYDVTNNVGYTPQVKHLPLLINEEDQKTNLWRRLPQVAVCEGELFLVARCIGEKAPECNIGRLPIVQHSSVGVWMMQTNADDWNFVTHVPSHLLGKLVEGSDGTDFIITSNSGSTLFFVLKGSPHMLAYDSTLHTWSVLPGCPSDYNTYPLHQGAFYEPLLWIPTL